MITLRRPHPGIARLWARIEDAARVLWPYLAFLMVHLLTGLVFLLDRAPGGPSGWGLAPADDTWATLVYARSFSESLTFTYNPGIPEAGMTSPLWVIAVGVAHRLLSPLGVGLPAVAQLIGIAFGAGVSAFGYLIVRRLTGWRLAAILAGMVIAIDPTFTFAKVSGSEAALFAMLSLGALWAVVSRRSTNVGAHGCAPLLLGLAALTRPEGLVLVGTAVLGYVARRLWERETSSVFDARSIHDLFLLVAPAAMAAGAWALYNLSVAGRPLPNSFYVAHENMGLVNPENLAAVWRGYAQHTSYLGGFQPVVTLGLAAAGAWSALRRAGLRALPLALFPVVAVYVLSALIRLPDSSWTFEFRQHLDPLLPYLVILATLGLAAIWRAMMGYADTQRDLDPKSRSQLRLTLLATVVALALVPIAGVPLKWPRLASEFSQSAKTISETAIPVARWLDANAPRDARVAVTEPGAIRYFSSHIPLIDLTGRSYHEGMGKPMLALAEDVSAEYVVAYDDLYVRSWPFGNEIAHAEGSSGARLVVYGTNWSADFAPRDTVRNVSLDGLRLIDSLDVGDPSEELGHAWEMNPLDNTLTRAFRTNPLVSISDDARITGGYESFRVAAAPGKDLIIVKRYDSGVRGALRVLADGQPVGVWRFLPRRYVFGESQFVIPASFITSDTVVLRFEHIPDRKRQTSLNSFYYWFFVRDAG
jgi:hypothetical protein